VSPKDKKEQKYLRLFFRTFETKKDFELFAQIKKQP